MDFKTWIVRNLDSLEVGFENLVLDNNLKLNKVRYNKEFERYVLNKWNKLKK